MGGGLDEARYKAMGQGYTEGTASWPGKGRGAEQGKFWFLLLVWHRLLLSLLKLQWQTLSDEP